MGLGLPQKKRVSLKQRITMVGDSAHTGVPESVFFFDFYQFYHPKKNRELMNHQPILIWILRSISGTEAIFFPAKYCDAAAAPGSQP